MEVTGAYGRRYFYPLDALRDWKEGKDFKILNGPYVSIRDIRVIRDMGYEKVHILLTSGIPITLWEEKNEYYGSE